RAVVQMLESAGVSLGSAAAGSGDGVQTSLPRPVDLVALMKRLEPNAERGTLVTARILRQHANIGKPEFDTLALQLARQGRLALHEHDFPFSLSPEAREELVTDGQGNYYIGLALRPGQGG